MIIAMISSPAAHTMMRDSLAAFFPMAVKMSSRTKAAADTV